MKRFISTILLASFCVSIVFSAYTKVPKKQKMKYRIEPDQSEYIYLHGDTDFPDPIIPNTRNSGTFTYVDKSSNGYGMVAQNTRPLFVDLDNETWFACYRQYAGELTTHGQIGAGFSEDGLDWATYTNLNYNGNPPWGGGGVGGTGVAQGRYPSAIANENEPVAIWNEYTGDTSTGSLYGGRPYYAFDEFGLGGGSFSYPADIDLLFEGNTEGKDLWVGSASISFDEDDDMFVVNTVYNDWTRGDRYLYHSEAYADGFIVFGEEQKVIDEVVDLVGGDDTGSFNTSPYVSFTPDGKGLVGLVGLFVGADTDTSPISQNHTGIFKLSDDHGASWHGCEDDPNDIANGCAVGASGDEYVFIPDSVWDDLIETQFNYDYYDPCEGTTVLLDSFWSYYEDDIKVDKDGNPHFLIQVLPCDGLEEGFCYYTPEAGLYHFTADRDELGNADAWSWSFVMTGEATWSFPDMTGETYIWNNSSSLAFSADDANIIYAVTNMATTGDIDPNVPNDPDGDLDAYCAHVTTVADYPTWSEDIYVIKSVDGGATWWNPLNVSNTPDETDGACPGVGVTKCDPAETYPHAYQYGTNDEVYIMYQMPQWDFNEIGEMLGADFMNYVYAGTAVVDDSDIPEYESIDTGSGCYADAGDITDDGTLNVLDIVALVNAILGTVPLSDTCAADLTGDGALNVLDIVALVNAILGNARAVNTIDDALSATLIVSDTFIELKSDGYVQGVELQLIHGNDFSISLEDAHISEYYTDGNKTTVLLVTDGIQSINKVAQIEGDYSVVSHIVSDSKSEMVPLTLTEVSDFSIGNAFPNPFNPSTTVELELNKESFVSINIYNIAGQLIDKVFSGDLSNSNHKITWDASSVSSGVYFMSIQVNDHIETKKLMLVK